MKCHYAMSSKLENKHKSKTFEALQQSTLIGLMNTIGFSFQLRRPERKANKTLQFFYVMETFYYCNRLSFETKISTYCDSRLEDDLLKLSKTNESYNLKTIKRRRELSRASMSFNLLVETLENIGFEFITKEGKKSLKTVKMIKIEKILYNNEIIFDKQQIKDIGEKVNKIVADFLESNKEDRLPIFNAFDHQVLSNFSLNNLFQTFKADTEYEEENQTGFL
ncbi:hypothetical protein EIN_168080 [Entamoeba invadens IP1]|uniref:Uncharacterized protein n=1 Tax=Entamoeba invadens IP1 TaxID=370355 RepID=A0A0A1U0Q0_ENTIV|nr:hypothetical protein EIN_168080 [Entamoeba invadens IP1]ELP84453.1 hypothetical protein EIN_168080 [Entamoeba invadens IP1]|eukprot:XP_004183799.1 hypothetical protein EIN_168080 [Entamoeba invadens IP1]